MFLSSPKVDSIFSSEKPASDSSLSLATQEFSSLTVLSRSFHSFTKVSAFWIHSSDTFLTSWYLKWKWNKDEWCLYSIHQIYEFNSYLSFKTLTSSSASLCVVIFMLAPSASSKIFRYCKHPFSKFLTLVYNEVASSKVDGFVRPSLAFLSELSSHGLNSLMPKLKL